MFPSPKQLSPGSSGYVAVTPASGIAETLSMKVSSGTL
jgi:hypothetical protein